MTGRVSFLWALFAVQLFCALYFAADALLDVFGIEDEGSWIDSDRIEYVIVAALFLGVLMTGRAINDITRQNKRLQDQMRAASGEFAQLIEDRFTEWGLTAAERDVALFSIKGLSVADIAEARGSAEGTIKAHSAAVYRKAGVSGRHQLLSLFVDELIETPLAAE
ncbi:MAG: helix-turn-helix transcriptional regulator [Paracoccaceae bacterium]|nr:helix-turn-helix transcriptional regulator [Paracoccaceae bacterium]